MTGSSRPFHEDGDWVSLIDGVRVSRRWMTRHTPHLLADWSDARTSAQQRAVATRILLIATELESEPDSQLAPPGQAWWATAERIDPRLTQGPDWPPLAAALTRAATAGCDMHRLLPELAATAPLPARHPARVLHWRLLDQCPAALPTPDATDGATAPPPGRPAARPSGRPDVHTPPGSPQNQRDAPPSGHGGTASDPTHAPGEGDQ